MVIEGLLGSLLGGVFRLAPEVLKWMDRKNERGHELAMFDKQIEADKLRGDQKQVELELQAEVSRMSEGIAALRSGLEGQFKQSGIAWVDALNVSVRPVITYSFFGLYSMVKIAAYVTVIQAGTGWANAAAIIWTDADMGLLSGILNFYFLGRVFDKDKRG